MDFKSNESSDGYSASADFYTEESYSLEVWLEVFPHLGKHTLKRIKSRIESGQYQLENFIPVDVLRRKLQQNIVELEYLVRCFGVQNKCVATNLKNMKKSHAMLNPKSQKQPIMITKCRHRKFVKRKQPVAIKRRKVSRGTSPYLSEGMLEPRLVEELVAGNPSNRLYLQDRVHHGQETTVISDGHLFNDKTQNNNNFSNKTRKNCKNITESENIHIHDTGRLQYYSDTDSEASTDDNDAVIGKKICSKNEDVGNDQYDSSDTDLLSLKFACSNESTSSSSDCGRSMNFMSQDQLISPMIMEAASGRILSADSSSIECESRVNCKANTHIWCEECNSRLVELKKQAVRIWMPFATKTKTRISKECDLLSQLEEELKLPKKLSTSLKHEKCEECGTSMQYLKTQALNMVHSLERATSQHEKQQRPGESQQDQQSNLHYQDHNHHQIDNTGSVYNNSSSETGKTSTVGSLGILPLKTTATNNNKIVPSTETMSTTSKLPLTAGAPRGRNVGGEKGVGKEQHVSKGSVSITSGKQLLTPAKKMGVGGGIGYYQHGQNHQCESSSNHQHNDKTPKHQQYHSTIETRHLIAGHEKQTNNNHHQKSSSFCPDDLPPRKDSPFPQAIASDKFYREQRKFQQKSGSPYAIWASQKLNQMLNDSISSNSANNNSCNGRSTPPPKHHHHSQSRNGKPALKQYISNSMELTQQDYANMNSCYATVDLLQQREHSAGGLMTVVDRPDMLAIPIQQYQQQHVYNNHQLHHHQQVVFNTPHQQQQQQQHLQQVYYHQPQYLNQPHHPHETNYRGIRNNDVVIPTPASPACSNNSTSNASRNLGYYTTGGGASSASSSASSFVPGAGIGGISSPGACSANSAGSGTAAAVSFFARAAQKLNISSKKRKKKEPPEPEPPPFPTNFRGVLEYNPPPAPPCLARMAASKLQNSGKVKVLLRICPLEGNHPGNYLNLDARKKQVTVYDPSAYSGYTTPSLRRPVAPRLFEFDSVFSQDDALAELCCSGLVDIIQTVVSGQDGCIFSYGHARLGKTYTMIGVDEGSQNLGIIPCSISWLFKLIDMQKERTGARFSVRVSAVEVTGKQEALKDLLADVANSQECERAGEKSPGVYLREDPICGTQLENQSELRAPTADKAAYYLDAAIAARTIPEVDEDARNSHLLFTIHVYQYRVDKGARSGGMADGVAGGRSRLHLLDLGSCSKSSKDGNSLSLGALGMAILALLNGQKHVPHRESKLTQLMRESLGNFGCRTCMIAHVSPAIHAYNETLQVIQLAAKIHRTKRRRKMMSGTSSDDSSCDGESIRHRRMRTGIRMGTLREVSLSDPDYTSSSEQSCDTVIYVGPHGHTLSDQELTDNERPPTSIPMLVPSRNVTPKIQPRTVPTFSRSRSHSGDESGSDGDRSTVISQAQSSHSCSSGDGGSRTGSASGRIPRYGSECDPSRVPPSGRVTPRMIPEPRMIQSSSKSRLGPSPLSFKGSYSSSSGSLSSNHPYHHHPQASHDPSLYGPAPLPGYFHGQGVDTSNSNSNTPTHSKAQQPGVQKQAEQWIDGPMMPYAKSSSSINMSDSRSQKSGVQSEHWVDGPSTSTPKNPVNPKALNEQWIDGPKEFLVDRACVSSSKISVVNNNNNTIKTVESNDSNKTSLIPKPATSTSSVSSSPQRRKQHHHHHVHHHKVQVHRHQDGKDSKSELTPSTVLNANSSDNNEQQSCVEQPSSTCKNSSSDQQHNCISVQNTSSKTTQVPVKSFVKDWVDKHSASPSVKTERSESNKKDRSCNKVSRKNSQTSLDEMLYGNSNNKDVSIVRSKKTTNSPNSSPRSSVSPSKHLNNNCAVKEDILPLTSTPSNLSQNPRTLAWVQSVQADTYDVHNSIEPHTQQNESNDDSSDNYEKPNSPKSELLKVNISEVKGENDNEISDLKECCDGKLVEHTKHDLSPPPDYETLVFSPPGTLENVIEEEEDEEESCDDVDYHVVNPEKDVKAQAVINMDSSLESTELEANDAGNFFMNNRESIYELQFDAEFELSKGSIRNSFHSEEDSWSLGSMPKDENSGDHLLAELETKDVDSIQVPALDSGYANHSLELASRQNDSENYTQLDNSFAIIDSDKEKIAFDTSTGISTIDSEQTNDQHKSEIVDSRFKYDGSDTNNQFLLVESDHDSSPLEIDASKHDFKNIEEQSDTTLSPNSEIDTPSFLSPQSTKRNSPVRPCFLRRPDGASNPNLASICETPKPSVVSSPGQETLYCMSSGFSSPISPPYLRSDFHDYETIGERRSVIGQSPDKEETMKPFENKKSLYVKDSNCSHVSEKPPVSFTSKIGILSKPSVSKSKETNITSLDKPVVPPRISSKLSFSSSPTKQQHSRSSSLKSDPSNSAIINKSSSESSHLSSLFRRSLSAPVKVSLFSVTSSSSKSTSKDKSKTSSNPTATRPSSIKPPKSSFSSRLPLCNGKRNQKDTTQQTSPTKSNASSSGKESRSSKDSYKSSRDSSKSSIKDPGKMNPTKENNSSSSSSSKNSLKDGKNSGKSCKETKSSRSKSPSPSKKDRGEKDSKLPLSRISFKSSSNRTKGCESDSGIESGRLKNDRQLLSSPSSSSSYSYKLRPRMSMHSTSSGHGSDVSSTFSSPATLASSPSKNYGSSNGIIMPSSPSPHHQHHKESRMDICNSSGYESMLRDSEVTGTSSSHDSTSESGHSDRSASKIPKKRSFSSKRSKSAPAYSTTSTPISSRHSSPNKKLASPAIGSPKSWADARWGGWETEPLEIKVYEIEDVERMARRRKEELELREVARRRLKIRELLKEQESLKQDLEHAKFLLMAQPESWSFDLHVAEQDRDDSDFLEALEKETQILYKRVEACKSRIMMVTCFDNNNTITTTIS